MSTDRDVIAALRLRRASLRDRVREISADYAVLRSASPTRTRVELLEGTGRLLRQAEAELGRVNDELAEIERSANERRALANTRRLALRGRVDRDATELIRLAHNALLAVRQDGRAPKNTDTLIRDLGDWLRAQGGPTNVID